jgi:dTMP kinase
VREYYIALEGIDGSGKSTQAKLLAEALRLAYPNREIFSTFEPGASTFGKELRAIAIDPTLYSAHAKSLAISLDRVLNIEENILPAFSRSAIVVSDRCFVSSIVYQQFGEGISEELIMATAEMAVGDNYPDLILWIDTPVEVAMERLKAAGKPADYFEAKGTAFQEKLRNGYLDIQAQGDLIYRVQDVGTPEQMSQLIFDIVKPMIDENAVEFLPKAVDIGA